MNGLPKLNCEIIACRDEPHWHENRLPRVQASEGSKILLGKGFEVYADKTSPPLIQERAEWQHLKLAMETPIAKEYLRKWGGKVHELPPYTICVSRQHPYIGCTPDRIIEDSEHDGPGNLQLKAWSEYGQREFAGGLPLYIEVQTQLEMLAEGVKWGYVCVAFGSQRTERFFTEPDPVFLAKAIPLLKDFWTCVELRQPPEIDGSEATTRALTRLHPQDNGLAINLPEGADAMLERLQRVKSLASRCHDRKHEIENQFRAALGDNTYGVTSTGQWVSWKSHDRAGYTVAPTTYKQLRTCKAPKDHVEFAGDAVDYKVAKRKRLPMELKIRLLQNQPRCRWCGAQLTLRTASFEHVIPLAVGGTNEYQNIDLACIPCNNERGSDAVALEASRR
jgi:predicted phage-related endonuclease